MAQVAVDIPIIDLTNGAVLGSDDDFIFLTVGYTATETQRSLDDLDRYDGLFIFTEEDISDDPMGGGGEQMPNPPHWQTTPPVGNVDWSFFTSAVDGFLGAPQIRFSGRGASLVSPSYAIVSFHATGGPGFYWLPRETGVEISRTCSKTLGVDYWHIAEDLAVIKLSSPIPSSVISPVPILEDPVLARGSSGIGGADFVRDFHHASVWVFRNSRRG
jgi:hypothetical protein